MQGPVRADRLDAGDRPARPSPPTPIWACLSVSAGLMPFSRIVCGAITCHSSTRPARPAMTRLRSRWS